MTPSDLPSPNRAPSDTEPHLPGLDPVAAARLAARPVTQSPWLNEEVARRMADRLGWIKQVPERWLHWAPERGGLEAHAALRARYPQATEVLGGPQASRSAQRLAQPGGPRWVPARWRPTSQPPVWPGSPGAEFDMLWANMALHEDAYPKRTLRLWKEALKVNGFLMFSCLGPDSLKELRAVHEHMGWPAPAHTLTDMHDLGDMLVEVGFAEPVMDMERITLTYASTERLLQDLREWGRNLSGQRFAACRSRAWLQRWKQALQEQLPRNSEGQHVLSFEVVYGHAVRPVPRARVEATSAISAEEMRQMLKAGNPRGR
jgi:malonyl-CoA O-methyltransferase